MVENLQIYARTHTHTFIHTFKWAVRREPGSKNPTIVSNIHRYSFCYSKVFYRHTCVASCLHTVHTHTHTYTYIHTYVGFVLLYNWLSTSFYTSTNFKQSQMILSIKTSHTTNISASILNTHTHARISSSQPDVLLVKTLTDQHYSDILTAKTN